MLYMYVCPYVLKCENALKQSCVLCASGTKTNLSSEAFKAKECVTIASSSVSHTSHSPFLIGMHLRIGGPV